MRRPAGIGLVRRGARADRDRRIAAEGPAAFAWLAGDLDRASGAVGDAALGTVDVGRRLVDYYGATLAAVIRDARSFPFDRLV